MTVSSSTAKVSYSGNGSTTLFAVPFYFLANSQLLVVLRASSGAETTQVLGTNYTVTGAGVLTGGSITMTVAPPSGTTLVISRNVPLTQETDLQPNDRLPAETLEQSLDKLTMLVQQIDETTDRTLKYPLTDSTSISSTLPASSDRAGKFLKFDSNGAPTAQALPAPFVSVKDFGAVGDGNADDTAAIQAGINATAAAGQTLYFPGGTYKIVPATLKDWEGTFSSPSEGQMTCAFVMPSNMCIYADVGATVKLANSVSTLTSPKRVAMFFSNVPVSNIRIYGLTMDMNGLNNRISPLAPASYNRYNQAHIHISGTIGGVAARGDNVTIDSCKFLNTAGTSCLVLAQSNTVGITLGKNWSITNCTFSNNGIDTDDHSSVFAWAEDVLCEGNIFTADTMFPNGISGNSGSFVAYEVHGANQRFVNNLISNYWQGMWVASNTTSQAANIIISNNTFSPVKWYAIDFFRTNAVETEINRVLIDSNTVLVDDTTLTGTVPTFKAAFQIASFYRVQNVQISNNLCSKSGATIPSVGILITPQGNASNDHRNIIIRDNAINGFVAGVATFINSTNGMGPLEISNNYFRNCSDATGYTTPQGISVGLSGVAPLATAYESLFISNNTFIDDRTVKEMDFGIRIDQVTVTNLNVQRQKYVGMVTGNYAEASTTVTNRLGYYEFISFTPVWKSGGSAVTLGDGVRNASYTVDEKQVTINASLLVGSTTSFGAGVITLDLPFTTNANSLQYIGNWRIFDTSTSTYYFGGAVSVNNDTGVGLQLNNGSNVTNTNPVTFANGDLISLQMTYTRA
jgi:hypothetical protein